MTRFARAKGSKSSNERAPEDSTPWEVMKDQLLQAKSQSEETKKREEAEKQRIENYENFLKEHKTQKRKATWCDFPETNPPNSKNTTAVPPKKKKKNKQKEQNGNIAVDQSAQATTDINESNTTRKKKNKKKHQPESTSQDNSSKTVTEPKQNSLNEDDRSEGLIRKKKDKKKKLIKNKVQSSEATLEMDSVEYKVHKEQNQENKSKNKNKKNKKQKSNVELNNSQETTDTQMPPRDKPNQNNNQQIKKKKDTKFVDGLPIRRKPLNDCSFQLIINGKEVELVRFDGFPIMKRDAERLEELKSNMIKKGIPKSEVNRTLKLERRRAEKALARLKRDVCYNCRKGGHNLSDCPELKTKIPGVGAPDGVCFKCGSTEHRQFECKVQQDKEFRFATCFICKEPGHIARQCPDNPKGLYPNGGGCKLCGDVTHLRKDCPTMMGKKEETSIKLQTLDSTDTLEGIEQKTNPLPQELSNKPKKIKF